MLSLPEIEEKILAFWKKNRIFEKSLERTKKGKRFVFFEGPPFANGLPGIHHLLSRAFKDAILRYKTMRGFFVERKAGWDTHGLPTELEAEKRLGIKTKKDIEKIGIEKFIKTCQESVFIYKKEWEDFTERIGFWLDLKNAYMTCSNDYIETLWWILKQLWEERLLYEGYQVVPYCPRCGTSLSSHEVAQGYKRIKEPSIFIKFALKNEKDTYFLVWTTTPWTLPGNVALAVGENIKYVKIKIDSEYFILAEERLKVIEQKYQVVEQIQGRDLLGLTYKPLFDFMEPRETIFRVIAGDFVSTEDGTGIVHIAPAFGEEDMEVIKTQNSKLKTQNLPEFPILLPVDEEGKFKSEVKKWAGMFVKDADPLITEDLKNGGVLYKEELYEHDYPFCWRCDSPLLYYAKTSWFIKMSAMKKDLLDNNKKINWVPEYLKEGRFGEWLKEVKDWNLSRERFWGTPLPIWQCQMGKSQAPNPNDQTNPKHQIPMTKQCDNIKVIGSIEELEKLSGKKIKDLHRPCIDEIIFKCEKCGGVMKRIPEVADCWFDSGSMPYAQWHYPFENKDKIDKKTFFPADFICEGIDQTRGWFYTLLAVSSLLNLGPAYKNVISHGIVLDEKGQKMSKSRGNIIWPKDVIDKFGADCARFYFYTTNPVAEPKRFDFKDVQDLSRRFFGTLWNSYVFFTTYVDESFRPKKNFQPQELLDRWIFSRLNNLAQGVIENLEKYYVVEAARLFEDFIDDLSNWYIRRSRRRFQRPSNAKEKEQAQQTLYCVLLNLAKLLAPFTPFISEEIYGQLAGVAKRSFAPAPTSVHICDYPQPKRNLIDEQLEQQMERARQIVAEALAQRAKAGIKVRQPLASIQISMTKPQCPNELAGLIKDEVNVKEITFGKTVKLDTKITSKLKEEGMVRDLIRQIQEMRKQAGLKPQDKIEIKLKTESEKLKRIIKKYTNFIKRETSAQKITDKEMKSIMLENEVRLDSKILKIGLKK